MQDVTPIVDRVIWIESALSEEIRPPENTIAVVVNITQRGAIGIFELLKDTKIRLHKIYQRKDRIR